MLIFFKFKVSNNYMLHILYYTLVFCAINDLQKRGTICKSWPKGH
jgi:hypothetical protein